MRIVWTKQALRGFVSARDFLTEESSAASSRFVERIEEAVRMLRRHPEIGRNGRVAETRELAVPGTPFIVVYAVDAKRIAVVAVIHGARRWPEAF